MDIDQARQNVGLDLDLNCFTLVTRKGTCDDISRNRPKIPVLATVDPVECGLLSGVYSV